MHATLQEQMKWIDLDALNESVHQERVLWEGFVQNLERGNVRKHSARDSYHIHCLHLAMNDLLNTSAMHYGKTFFLCSGKESESDAYLIKSNPIMMFKAGWF